MNICSDGWHQTAPNVTAYSVKDFSMRLSDMGGTHVVKVHLAGHAHGVLGLAYELEGRRTGYTEVILQFFQKIFLSQDT